MRLFVLVFGFFLVFQSVPCFADNAKDLEKIEEEFLMTRPEEMPDAPPRKPLMNPYVTQINAQTEALGHVLTKEDRKNLAVMRNAYGMIQSVVMVQEQVDKAVNACIAENADMKEDIEEQYTTWKDQVGPVLATNNEAYEASLSKAYFTVPDDVRAYLETINKAALFANSRIYNVPLTDEKACKKLVKSLKRTPGKLVKILSTVEWPSSLAEEE